MQGLYEYLLQWWDYTDFPAPTQYIRGMPIQTYQIILQSISPHTQLYYHCPLPINQCILSTLGAEGFFSELTQMEFTGLGCPKSVDIPRLITYCTAMNNIRHDPDRGFEFHTTSTSAYPYHLLDPPISVSMKACKFDMPSKQKHHSLPTALCLPKAIMRDTLTVWESYKKNEMKIPYHKRRGLPDNFKV